MDQNVRKVRHSSAVTNTGNILKDGSLTDLKKNRNEKKRKTEKCRLVKESTKCRKGENRISQIAADD